MILELHKIINIIMCLNKNGENKSKIMINV